MASQLVDKTIDDEELCVRCIHHPLMYSASKNKLKEEAFQPKWDERDASLLRLRYCDEDFCVAHGQTIEIKGSAFIGLATIRPIDVKAVNEWSESDESMMKYDGAEEKSNGIKAQIVYYLGNDFKFRMAISNNVFLRKGYRFLYFNFFKKSIGKWLEEKIHNMFYK